MAGHFMLLLHLVVVGTLTDPVDTTRDVIANNSRQQQQYHHQQYQHHHNPSQYYNTITTDIKNGNYRQHTRNNSIFATSQILLPSFMMQEMFDNDTLDYIVNSGTKKQPENDKENKNEDIEKAHARLKNKSNSQKYETTLNLNSENSISNKNNNKISNNNIGRLNSTVADSSETVEPIILNNNNNIRSRRFRSRLRRVSNYNTVGIASIESNEIFADDGILSAISRNKNNSRHGNARARNSNGRHNNKNDSDRSGSSNSDSRSSNGSNSYINNSSNSSNISSNNNGRRKGHNKARHSTYFNDKTSNIVYKNNNNILNNNANNNSNDNNYTTTTDTDSDPNKSSNRIYPSNILENLNQSLAIFQTSRVSATRNSSSKTEVRTLPTPEILPLDDVTNSYDVIKGGADLKGTNGTRDRGNPGDAKRPYFPLKQEPTSPTVTDVNYGYGDDEEGYNDGQLHCYTCSATSADRSCYSMPEANETLMAETTIPSRPCNRSQHFCMVSRVWFFSRSGSNRTEHQFSIERRCEETCDPYCIMMGDRTRIEINACRSCCNTPDCNTGNGAAAATSLHWVALGVAIISGLYLR